VIAGTLILAILAVPSPTEAKQPTKVARVGFLHGGEPNAYYMRWFDAFRQGLRERGWEEGRTATRVAVLLNPDDPKEVWIHSHHVQFRRGDLSLPRKRQRRPGYPGRLWHVLHSAGRNLRRPSPPRDSSALP
jgi:hypothetical protein